MIRPAPAPTPAPRWAIGSSTNWSGGIRAAPLSGGAPIDVARPTAASPLALFYLAVEGGKVLFVTAEDRAPALLLLAIDEADPTAPGSYETLSAPAPRVLAGFASAGGVAYWAEADGIHRASVR